MADAEDLEQKLNEEKTVEEALKEQGIEEKRPYRYRDGRKPGATNAKRIDKAILKINSVADLTPFVLAEGRKLYIEANTWEQRAKIWQALLGIAIPKQTKLTGNIKNDFVIIVRKFGFTEKEGKELSKELPPKLITANVI